MSGTIDIALARALAKLSDAGGQSNPVDARLTVRDASRLVQCGWAEAIDAPKLMLTAAGVDALGACLAVLKASTGARA